MKFFFDCARKIIESIFSCMDVETYRNFVGLVVSEGKLWGDV